MFVCLYVSSLVSLFCGASVLSHPLCSHHHCTPPQSSSSLQSCQCKSSNESSCLLLAVRNPTHTATISFNCSLHLTTFNSFEKREREHTNFKDTVTNYNVFQAPTNICFFFINNNIPIFGVRGEIVSTTCGTNPATDDSHSLRTTRNLEYKVNLFC